MADAACNSTGGRRAIALGDGDDLSADVPRHFDDGEQSKVAGTSPECKTRPQGHVRKAVPLNETISFGCRDAADDDSAIQTIRISNAASCHWLAIDNRCLLTPAASNSINCGSNCSQEFLHSASLPIEQTPEVIKSAGAQEGELLQTPYCWRKRLKQVACQENGEIKRESKREIDHASDRCLKDRRLSRDDHGDEARARCDKIRISPSAKKDLTTLRVKGQLVNKSTHASSHQSPNLLTSKPGKKGLKSQMDSESAFTRQVVKPMKSSVIQRNRAIYPSAYVATKNVTPPFVFSGKRMVSNHHLDAFGCSGQVTTKMVEKVMKARLYLLQQTGPNSFLIGGDSPDHKNRVIIGPQKCSCGRESLCIHLLFVMLRVFQVPQNDPILSRRPLKNYEVEALFRNYHARRTSRLKDNTKKKTGYRTESKNFDHINSKVEGEECDNDDDDDDVESLGAAVSQSDDGIEKEEEEEELCSICLLTMVEGESLTECKTGCQNRLHHHCIAIWFEECRRQKEPLICPLCRAEWKSEEGCSSVTVSQSDLLPLPPVMRESSPHNAVPEAEAPLTEPLPPEHRDMAEKWIPVVGDDIVVRLFSKNWGVRETALRLLSQEAVGVLLLGVGEGRSGVLVSPERQANNHMMLECCCSILSFSLSDPVYKVFVSGLRALRMILSYTPCRDELQQSRLQMLMKPVVKSLLLKCADSNRKTSQLSISALEELVKGQEGELAVGREIVNPGNQGLGGVGYLIDCIVEIDAVENLHWQWILGRFCMLEQLLDEYSIEFTVTSTSLPHASDAGPSDWITASTNYTRAFSILRFCTFHMSFAHIKVSRMARRVFYYIARLQLPYEAVFERACLLLNDVEVTIQSHMKRKLYALVEDYRTVPNGKSDPSISVEANSAAFSSSLHPPPMASGVVLDSVPVLPQVSIIASSPVTDMVTFVLSNAALRSTDGVLSETGATVCSKSSAIQLVPLNLRNWSQDASTPVSSLTTVREDCDEKEARTQGRQVEYVDACVSTSPLLIQDLEPWVTKKTAMDSALENNISNTLGDVNDHSLESCDSGVDKGNESLGNDVEVIRPDSEQMCSVSRPNAVVGLPNSSLAVSCSTGSKESLCDSPPILSVRLGAAFGMRQVGMLTEDLSDLILSSGSEEKVSFKTEVATTPQNSPQRSANNTADDGCHCKEEVEKEEAEALVEALERSDLPQDALPHVPGLSRGKSETTLTIHLQDQSAIIMGEDGFDSRHQYQEGVHWRRGHVLGTGAFSTCYQARDNRTGTLMAVKQISFCRNTLSEQEKVVNAVKEEIHILGRLSHPNIIRILGATQQGCHFFMFVEWMPGCSVASLLDRYGQFSEQVITSYTLQVLRGLTYLHDNQVLHRDLKGANLLIDSTGHRVRIGDFGAAARLATRLTGAGEFEGQLLGTIAFMAPEVLRGDTYGRKCDIWSFGCTMVEMATALPPWGANDISNHLALIFKIASTVNPPPIPENLSPPVRDVMLRCLEINPEDRPLAKDLLKHPLFRI